MEFENPVNEFDASEGNSSDITIRIESTAVSQTTEFFELQRICLVDSSRLTIGLSSKFNA